MQALKRHGPGAARKADTVGYLGDRPDRLELPAVPRHEQHSLLIAHIDGERE